MLNSCSCLLSLSVIDNISSVTSEEKDSVIRHQNHIVFTCSLVSATVWPQEENSAKGSGFKYLKKKKNPINIPEKKDLLWMLSKVCAWLRASLGSARTISRTMVRKKPNKRSSIYVYMSHELDKCVYSPTCAHKLNKHVSFCIVYHAL